MSPLTLLQHYTVLSILTCKQDIKSHTQVVPGEQTKSNPSAKDISEASPQSLISTSFTEDVLV